MDRAPHLPQEWKKAAEAIETEPGIVLLLGGTSSGKTTFVKYFVDRHCHGSNRIAVVDADIGQSTIGPPATISALAIESRTRELEMMEPQAMFFVGSTSPTGHLLQTLVGTKKMVDWALAHDPALIFVDTTGMVQGTVGTLLKFHKIDLIQPHHLIVIQREGELELLIHPFIDRKRIRIHRLPISGEARPRTPEERRAYRERRFREYFSKASVRLRSTSGLTFMSWRGPGLSEHLEQLPRYLLMGLNDGNHQTLALGILEVLDRNSKELFVFTPLSDLSVIKHIVVGSLRVDLNGRELDEGSS